MSLALRIWTPWPLIPGTHAAFSACCAFAPKPDESIRKCEVGEQSSKCQKPNPRACSRRPPSGAEAAAGSEAAAAPEGATGPEVPPVPKLPPLPTPRRCRCRRSGDAAVRPSPPAPGATGAPGGDRCSRQPACRRSPCCRRFPFFAERAATAAAAMKVVSPAGPISVVPSGVPMTALVSGSVYSSYVSRRELRVDCCRYSQQRRQSQLQSTLQINPDRVRCSTRIPSVR